LPHEHTPSRYIPPDDDLCFSWHVFCTYTFLRQKTPNNAHLFQKNIAKNCLCLLVTLYLTFVARSQRCKRIINSLTCNFHVLGRREGIGTCIHVDTSKAFNAMHRVALLHTINRKVSDVADSLKIDIAIISARHLRTALFGARLCTRYSYSYTHTYAELTFIEIFDLIDQVYSNRVGAQINGKRPGRALLFGDAIASVTCVSALHHAIPRHA